MANNLLVVIAASESDVSNGRTVNYVGTISNISTSPVTILAIAVFDSDGGAGNLAGNNGPGSISITVPAATGGAFGTAQFTFARTYYNGNNPQSGPRYVTAGCTVYGSDGSVCTSNSPQADVFNINAGLPSFSTGLGRLWTQGQMNASCLQDSALVLVTSIAPQASMFV